MAGMTLESARPLFAGTPCIESGGYLSAAEAASRAVPHTANQKCLMVTACSVVAEQHALAAGRVLTGCDKGKDLLLLPTPQTDIDPILLEAGPKILKAIATEIMPLVTRRAVSPALGAMTRPHNDIAFVIEGGCGSRLRHNGEADKKPSRRDQPV